MAFTLVIEASVYKNGPKESREIPNFPVDGAEAVKMGLLEDMYNGYVRSLTIDVQNKIRAEYKTPASGVRTKRGSSLDQARAAKLKMASEQAAQNVE
jgi:hypothetical protein